MVIFLLNTLKVITITVLMIFSVRRLIFALTAMFTKVDWDLRVSGMEYPFVMIFIPCHNEEKVICGTLDALLTLEYPKDKLEIVVIDDMSSDNTFNVAQKYEIKYPNIHALRRSGADRVRGKAAALNEALSQFRGGDIIYFIDADHRVEPDSLIRLTRHFSDPKTGAAGGRCIPWNKYDSNISSYVYTESLVHFRVTMYSSDRLGLAPGVLGTNYCIRRSFLEKAGYFNEKFLAEDIDMSARIYDLGYIVKYDVTSITRHEAPDSIQNYVMQHLRWNRGYNHVARSHWREILKNKNIPLLRRIDEVIFSLGYMDRFFFMIALGLTFLNLFLLPSFYFPLAVWIIFLGLPALQIITAMFVENEKASMYIRLPIILSMFSVDIYVALLAMCQDLMKKPNRWDKSFRVGDGSKSSNGDTTS